MELRPTATGRETGHVDHRAGEHVVVVVVVVDGRCGNPARLLPLGYLLKVTHWTRTSDARVTTLPQQPGNTKLCKACHFPSMSWFAPEPESHHT